MWFNIKDYRLSAAIIISSSISYSTLAIVCRDTNTNCQSCGDTVYPRDEFYRENCMKSCGVCKGTNIAFDKPTDASYRFNNFETSQVVDGVTDVCGNTGFFFYVWWCVDLLQTFNIDSINLFGIDCEFEIKISSSGTCSGQGFQSATLCYKDTSSTVQDIYTIERCNQPNSTSIYARTVYVIHPSKPLALCEVQIFSATSMNVALGKQTRVNTNTGIFDRYTSGVVDGNTNGSCTSLSGDKHVTWSVDLQNLYYLNQIIIYNSQNPTDMGRLQGFEIWLWPRSSGAHTLCYKDTTSTIQPVYTVTGCNQGSATSFSGRIVEVFSHNESLSLCEVEIFSDVAQCNTGYYSSSRSTCQPCNTCLGDTCDPYNGVCTGYCKPRFYDTTCTGDCKTGFYGAKCQQNCNDNCLNNNCSKSDGRCNDCKPDTVGPYCNLTCGTECQPRTDLATSTCDRNGRCTYCVIGRYGDECYTNCITECDGGCSRANGICTNCITGRYGYGCDMACSIGCDGGCHRNDGRCTPCIKGKTGDKCDINCNTDCAVCNQDNADSCSECKDGRWGTSCNKLCSTNCKPVVGTPVAKCDKTFGVCGDGCKTGFYGVHCNNDCRSNCKDGLCDQMTGDCINGCLPGKIGSNCSKDCEEGSYGENCNMRCGNCFDETPCDVITGSCTLVGCADFFQGLTCHQRIPPSSSPVIYIVISMFCGVLGTAAAFLSYYFYKKSRQMNKQNREVVLYCVDGDKDINPTSSTTNDAVTTGYGDITSNTHNVDYENQLFDTGDNTRNVLVH